MLKGRQWVTDDKERQPSLIFTQLSAASCVRCPVSSSGSSSPLAAYHQPSLSSQTQCLQFPILTLSSFLSSCFQISCATPSKPTTGLRGQAEEIVSSHPRAIQINYTNRLLLQGVFNHKCHSEFPLGKSGIIFIHQNQLKYD